MTEHTKNYEVIPMSMIGEFSIEAIPQVTEKHIKNLKNYLEQKWNIKP